MNTGPIDYLMSHPQWVIVSILAGTGLVFWRLMRQEVQRLKVKERFDRHQCVNCGYDLRATDDRCPECGFPIQEPELPLTIRLSPSALRKDWPEAAIDVRKPGAEEYQVEVYTSQQTFAVDLLAEHLEAIGISTNLRVSTIKSVSEQAYGVTSAPFKTVSVWSGDAQRAIKIIRSCSEAAREHPRISPKQTEAKA
jgi:hypothetical protein